MADETKQPDPQQRRAGSDQPDEPAAQPEQPETTPGPSTPIPQAPAASPPPVTAAPAPPGRRAALPLVAVGLAGLLLGGVLGSAGTAVVDHIVDRSGYERPEPARGDRLQPRR